MHAGRLLDLARAEAVAGDVDHVVGAAEDEVVPVLVADSPVEGGVDQLVLEVLEVGLHEALVVAHTVLMQPGGSGGAIVTTPFSPSGTGWPVASCSSRTS